LEPNPGQITLSGMATGHFRCYRFFMGAKGIVRPVVFATLLCAGCHESQNVEDSDETLPPLSLNLRFEDIHIDAGYNNTEPLSEGLQARLDLRPDADAYEAVFTPRWGPPQEVAAQVTRDSVRVGPVAMGGIPCSNGLQEVWDEIVFPRSGVGHEPMVGEYAVRAVVLSYNPCNAEPTTGRLVDHCSARRVPDLRRRISVGVREPCRLHARTRVPGREMRGPAPANRMQGQFRLLRRSGLRMGAVPRADAGLSEFRAPSSGCTCAFGSSAE